jgi:hypothetical protein
MWIAKINSIFNTKKFSLTMKLSQSCPLIYIRVYAPRFRTMAGFNEKDGVVLLKTAQIRGKIFYVYPAYTTVIRL